MSGSESINDSANYLTRVESFHRLDNEREDMLKELITKYQDLEQRFQSKCRQHDNEAQTRSLYQEQANEANKKLIDIQHRTEINSFVFAIIDGDGAVFREDWIIKGAEGGVIAAQQLRLDIKTHLKNIYPDVNVDLWNIIVQITLNLEGLSRKLEKVGLAKNFYNLPDFTRGFSRAQGLFSIIDVGWGKEQADFKVRETLRLMVHNLQCKHIVFGPCHDRGYIVELRPYQLDTLISTKLSLLETTTAPRDFQELRFRRVRFNDVFRSEPLPDGPPPPSSPPPPVMLSPMQPMNLSGTASRNTPDLTSSIPPRITSNITSIKSSPSPTFKESRKFMSTPDDSARSTAPPLKYYLVNVRGDRVDEEIPPSDADAEFRLLMRTNKENEILGTRGPCNRYHLNGKCDIRPCIYYHGERLGFSEQNVLKRKARSMLCGRKSSCWNSDCFWGHHCKFGSKCLRRDCNFYLTHSVDTVSYLSSLVFSFNCFLT
ncbi:hypothetical protein F4781DRAFT_387408 [Annulohypoxylon bovei var. microspora]|nr:hypothetical protein F4781DRAFT_387408 [Annulohypoxylon bovei var. microspora]